jgi:hypothetical protein
MICVTLEDGQKRMFNEHIIFGVKELTEKERAEHLKSPALLMTKIQLPTGPAAFMVQEPFDYLASLLEGIMGTENGGNKLLVTEENIMQITETSLAERQGNVLCNACIRTSIKQPTGFIIFYVQETVENLASRKPGSFTKITN